MLVFDLIYDTILIVDYLPKTILEVVYHKWQRPVYDARLYLHLKESLNFFLPVRIRFENIFSYFSWSYITKSYYACITPDDDIDLKLMFGYDSEVPIVEVPENFLVNGQLPNHWYSSTGLNCLRGSCIIEFQNKQQKIVELKII